MFGQKTMINYSLENTPLKAMAIINLVREEVILTSQGCLFGTCTKGQWLNTCMMITMRKISKMTLTVSISQYIWFCIESQLDITLFPWNKTTLKITKFQFLTVWLFVYTSSSYLDFTTAFSWPTSYRKFKTTQS